MPWRCIHAAVRTSSSSRQGNGAARESHGGVRFVVTLANLSLKCRTPCHSGACLSAMSAFSRHAATVPLEVARRPVFHRRCDRCQAPRSVGLAASPLDPTVPRSSGSPHFRELRTIRAMCSGWSGLLALPFVDDLETCFDRVVTHASGPECSAIDTSVLCCCPYGIRPPASGCSFQRFWPLVRWSYNARRSAGDPQLEAGRSKSPTVTAKYRA